jgi:hexosaminidase
MCKDSENVMLSFVCLIAVALAAGGGVALPTRNFSSFPPMWPVPQEFTNGTGTTFVARQLQLVMNATASHDVTSSFARFVARTFYHPTSQAAPGSAAITRVLLTIADTGAPLQLYVNESYTLEVSATAISIVAATNYGAYHALETLSQLIGFNYDAEQYEIRGSPWAITDAPRFPHRGILIDTARHFLPLPTLYKVIDSLTMAKFNTMHWHMVDAEAFPFDSVAFPRLGKFSAFSQRERYTPGDVALVVEHARQRGVRVMMEFDTPGHSASMCAAYPDICPSPTCPSKNINNWALDVTKNETYTIVEALWTEFGALLPERLLHIGGDEVDYYCWSLHPRIMAWLKVRNLTLAGGFEYYVKRVQAFIWDKLAGDREVVAWNEVWNHFGTALNKKTIIQMWLPNSTTVPKNVTSHGYRLIWSDSSVWYLDHVKGSWQVAYSAEPCTGLPEAGCALVLGGEGAMWGTTVDTSNIVQTIWPRAAAIAERLWSPRHYTDVTAAEPRLIAFRCLLNERGVAAAPTLNTVAAQSPPNPGSCFWQ